MVELLGGGVPDLFWAWFSLFGRDVLVVERVRVAEDGNVMFCRGLCVFKLVGICFCVTEAIDWDVGELWARVEIVKSRGSVESSTKGMRASLLALALGGIIGGVLWRGGGDMLSGRLDLVERP